MQKSFPSVLPRRVYQVPLRMYSKYSQKKPAKHKTTSGDKILKRCSIVLSKKNHLEAKKRRSGIRKRVTTHKSNCPSRHLPFPLIWRRLFFSLLMCTTTTTRSWKLWQLLSRRFQSLQLNKIPRTKLTRSKRKEKQKAVCQSRPFTRQNFVLSAHEALKFADFNIGWCRRWRNTVRLCSTTSS